MPTSSESTPANRLMNLPARHLINVRHMLVPTDFSDTSLKALQYALPMAELFGAQITLLHVADSYSTDTGYLSDFPPLGMQPKLSELGRRLIPAALLRETLSIPGKSIETIVSFAQEKEVDLIVMSTHGHTGLKRAVIGSTAEGVIRHACCPVLIVRKSERDFA